MNAIHIDHAGFIDSNPENLDHNRPALWTFSINNRDISFWGTYPQAASTAQLYAQTHGGVAEAIRLIDCTGMLRGATTH